MPAPIVPPALRPVLAACRSAGGRPLLVGGCVRDALMGIAQKDVDVEVHHLPLAELRTVLARFGKVSEVGRSFGVLKVRIGRDEYDFSLPRRDSKVGAGHRGISVIADPELGVVEAARRRDLTINAIGYDDATGAFEDPFDGRGDLARGVLRAVDQTTFGEDPLRALRVAQFCARFGFSADESLTKLCAEMPLAELPSERVLGEVEKLLLLGVRPDLGWTFGYETGIWRKVLPWWDKPSPPNLGRLAMYRLMPETRRLAAMFACTVSSEEVHALFDALRLHRWRGYPLRAQVAALVSAKSSLPTTLSDAQIRTLAETADVPLFAALLDDPSLAIRAAELGVALGPLPRLLAGRDLQLLGVHPGPAMGLLLDSLRLEQLAGNISTAEQARAWAACQRA